LGCVTPVIIPPGDYSNSDLEWTAKHLAGMVSVNVSFNCTAGKIYILSKGWAQKDALIQKVRELFKGVPTQYPYYPGAQDRYQKILNKYPNAEKISSPTKPDHIPWTMVPNIPITDNEYLLDNEPFCPVMGWAYIDESDPGKFLDEAVKVANTKIWGNLSVNLVIHPSIRAQIDKNVEDAITNLNYGAVAVNCWGSMNYGVGSFWGGYTPVNTLANVQSGIGYVHNNFLFDYPYKSVLRSAFKMPFGLPFPWFPKYNGFGYCLQKITEAVTNDRTSSFLGAVVANLLYGK